MLEEGLMHTGSMVVTEEKTAKAFGSGDLPVLATPAMVALMENAAMLAVVCHLEEGATTVGGHIDTSHLKPSKVGAVVEATAVLKKIEGRKLTFRVVAKEGEVVIGEGEHLRFVVGKERFMDSLEKR